MTFLVAVTPERPQRGRLQRELPQSGSLHPLDSLSRSLCTQLNGFVCASYPKLTCVPTNGTNKRS
jgi:hypothetical protein